MRIIPRHPNKGYLDSNLWIPKSCINVEGVKNALTFETETRSENILVLYSETDSHLIVPREFWPADSFDFEVLDCRPKSYPRVEIRSKVVLDSRRPHRSIQREAFAALLSAQGGILQLGCGSGKTVIALAALEAFSVPALIVVDNTGLLQQWEEEIGKHLDVPGGVGRIQANQMDWQKPVVLATYQTLAMRAAEFPEEVRRWFGVIIWDECFPAGTKVDGRPIEALKEGELVRSFNHETGKIESKRIIRRFSSSPSRLVGVRLRDGTTIVCTPGHPFHTLLGYVPAEKLLPQDVVTKWGHGMIPVTAVEHLDPTEDGTFGGVCPDGLVYNIEVEGNHNYFVDDVLVHNCHHSGAPTFCRSVDLFYGRRFGLTATPERADGAHVIYRAHLGPVLYKNLEQELKPRICFYWTGLSLDMTNPAIKEQVCDRSGQLHTSRLAVYYGGWKERLDLLLRELKRARHEGRQILILSHSVRACVNLMAMYIGQKTLYTDIPYPRAEELGLRVRPHTLPPKKLDKLRERLEHAKTRIPIEKREIYKQALEQDVEDINRLLEEHDAANTLRLEYERRQKQYIDGIIEVPSDVGLLIGDVAPKTRARMLKEKNIIFALMRYGREGLDKPSLDTILVSEPVTQKGGIQQLMGRILGLRASEEKHPIVIFFEDEIGPSLAMCQKVRKLLRAWPTDEGGPYQYEHIGYPRTQRPMLWTQDEIKSGQVNTLTRRAV